MNRIQTVIVYDGKAHKARQLVHESKDEFRGRAVCAVNMPEGAEYFCFEDERGLVSEHTWGMHRVYHLHAQDDRKPGLFHFVRGKVYAMADHELATPLATTGGAR